MPEPVFTMSAPATSATPSEPSQLDSAVDHLRAHASELARLAPAAKADLLRQCIPRVVEAAAAWVAQGTKAKGLAPDQVAEEWLAGPLPTLRNARLLAESLDAIAERGRPPLGT